MCSNHTKIESIYFVKLNVFSFQILLRLRLLVLRHRYRRHLLIHFICLLAGPIRSIHMVAWTKVFFVNWMLSSKLISMRNTSSRVYLAFVFFISLSHDSKWFFIREKRWIFTLKLRSIPRDVCTMVWDLVFLVRWNQTWIRIVFITSTLELLIESHQRGGKIQLILAFLWTNTQLKMRPLC